MPNTTCCSPKGPPRPYNPTPGERTAALGHLRYEIGQLISSDRRVGHTTLDKALLESSLVHVRTLLEFFEAKTRKLKYGGAEEQDDVIPSDFEFRNDEKIPGSDDHRGEINSHLAHLSYTRCRNPPTDRTWNFDRAVKPVLVRSQTFIEYLIPELTKYNCAKDKEEWLDLLRLVKTRLDYEQDSR